MRTLTIHAVRPAGRPDPWSAAGTGRRTSLSRSLPLLSTYAPALSSPRKHPSIHLSSQLCHLFLRPASPRLASLIIKLARRKSILSSLPRHGGVWLICRTPTAVQIRWPPTAGILAGRPARVSCPVHRLDLAGRHLCCTRFMDPVPALLDLFLACQDCGRTRLPGDERRMRHHLARGSTTHITCGGGNIILLLVQYI